MAALLRLRPGRHALGAVVALAAALLLFLHPAHAGGYNGRPRRLALYAESEHYFNHVPAPSVSAANMPRDLNWCDTKGGISYCTSSWNQARRGGRKEDIPGPQKIAALVTLHPCQA